MTTNYARAARRAAPLALALLGGAPLLPAFPVPAAAATLIQSCPYTIIAPGTYVLDRDLTCPTPAITITADDVRLDLGGNTLTGGGGGDGIVAEGTEADPITGLRIGNGTVTNVINGLNLDFAPGARVAGLTVTDASDDGIDVEDSPGVRITGNTLAGNGFGIWLPDCGAGCVVTGNRVVGNSGLGVYVSDALRARIAGNTVTGNGSTGIDANGCVDCLIAGNRSNDNRFEGILIGGTSTGSRVEGNTANGNEDKGIELAGPGVDDNQVRGNTANGNEEDGIRVALGATGNRLEGNRATGNNTDSGSGSVDLDDRNLPACVNTWRGNRFATDNEGDGPGAGCIR